MEIPAREAFGRIKEFITQQIRTIIEVLIMSDQSESFNGKLKIFRTAAVPFS